MARGPPWPISIICPFIHPPPIPAATHPPTRPPTIRPSTCPPSVRPSTPALTPTPTHHPPTRPPHSSLYLFGDTCRAPPPPQAPGTEVTAEKRPRPPCGHAVGGGGRRAAPAPTPRLHSLGVDLTRVAEGGKPDGGGNCELQGRTAATPGAGPARRWPRGQGPDSAGESPPLALSGARGRDTPDAPPGSAAEACSPLCFASSRASRLRVPSVAASHGG